MMRRRLFIGSSGEHFHICEMIRTHLDAKCSGWLDVEIWKGSGVFQILLIGRKDSAFLFSKR